MTFSSLTLVAIVGVCVAVVAAVAAFLVAHRHAGKVSELDSLQAKREEKIAEYWRNLLIQLGAIFLALGIGLLLYVVNAINVMDDRERNARQFIVDATEFQIQHLSEALWLARIVHRNLGKISEQFDFETRIDGVIFDEIVPKEFQPQVACAVYYLRSTFWQSPDIHVGSSDGFVFSQWFGKLGNDYSDLVRREYYDLVRLEREIVSGAKGLSRVLSSKDIPEPLAKLLNFNKEYCDGDLEAFQMQAGKINYLLVDSHFEFLMAARTRAVLFAAKVCHLNLRFGIGRSSKYETPDMFRKEGFKAKEFNELLKYASMNPLCTDNFTVENWRPD